MIIGLNDARRWKRSTIAALLTGAAGVAVLWAAGMSFPTPIPPGIALLGGAAALVAIAPWRWGAGVGVAIGLYTSTLIVARGVPDLVGAYGAAVAIGRWIQLTGSLAAVILGSLAVVASYRAGKEVGQGDHGPRATPRSRAGGERSRGHAAQVATLLVLAPVCAEYLAAYADSTGDAGELLLGLLFFSPLYGAPALLIREVARRAGLGWTGMILMAAAFGLVQAGVVDQSLFSTSYMGIESWAASRRSTLIEPLGLSAHMAQLFIGGHVIYSTCAPIALVEALRPGEGREPWLLKSGLVVTTIVYVGMSAVILVEHLSTEVSHASPAQVAASLLIACGLVAAAFRLGRRNRIRVHGSAPRPGTLFVLSFSAAGVMTAAPESWPGALLAITVLALGAVGLVAGSRTADWDARHHVAVAAGALISRGALAFTYFPVMGEVAPLPKYAHNGVLLAMVMAISVLAWSRTVAWKKGERSSQRD